MDSEQHIPASIRALLRAQRAVVSSLDLAGVLRTVVSEAAAIAGASAVRLLLLDEGGKTLRFGAGIGLPEDVQQGIAIPIGESFSGEAVHTRHPVAVADVRSDPRVIYRAHVTEYGLVSHLSLPVEIHDEIVGVLVFNTTHPRDYTEGEIVFLSAFADQAGIAIKNARAQEQAKRLAQQLTTLTRLTQSLVAATRAVTVGQEVMAAVRALMPESPARLWDLTGEDLGTLTLIASVGLQDARGGTVRFRKGEGLAGAAASSRRTVVSRDLLQDPRFINKGWAEQEKLVSAILTPLMVGDKVRGILAVFTRKPYEFSESETALFESLAAHAAIALENAGLHEAAIRRGDEMEALLRASRSLMAGLDLEQVLDRIVAEAARISGCRHIKVLLLDRETGLLRIGVRSGTTLPLGFPMPLGTGLSGIVAQTGNPLFVPDTHNDPRSVLAAQDRSLGLLTYLGLPIKIRGEVLGVLTFNTGEPKEYSAAELAYLTSFADQAALAIENAHLYERVRQQAADLEARVRERTVELERALQVKGDFLTRMSHEFRTPLNFVLGFTDLLQRETAGPLTAMQARYLDRIRTGGQHLLDLVSNLLELTALEGEQGRLRLETVALAELAQEIVELQASEISRKALAVRTAIAPELRAVVDRAKVAQILRHLLGNAVKFTPAQGAITLKARVVEDAARGRTGLPSSENPLPPSVEIVVEDTGIGILPENVERIFRVFEQGDDSPTRAYGGAGLGLTMVRALVERHGGTVWAESAGSGKGARFVVRLPRLEPPGAKRILIVEDAPATLRLTSAMLRDAGYTVDGAGTATSAAAALARGGVDLLLLDLGLPDRPGLEVLRELRAAAPTQSLPILVMTGLGELKGDEALALGADEYVTKPVSPTILLRVVEELLRLGQGYRRGSDACRDGFVEYPTT